MTIMVHYTTVHNVLTNTAVQNRSQLFFGKVKYSFWNANSC